jgi:dipeptidyl aminopeptidase/acylaminoacyl peptidase
MKSDAWNILSSFQGELLVIQAGQDDVIPKELVEKIFESAQAAKKKELCVVPGAPHRILRYLDEYPEERKRVFDKILDFIK